MRTVVQLRHRLPEFSLSTHQAERLRRDLPRCDLVFCDDRASLLGELPGAEVAIVWEFLPEWYQPAARLRLVMTPAAGRELVHADPRGLVETVHGTFHGRIMSESLLAMIGFVNRRFGVALEAQQRRAWERGGYANMRRLAGQTVLIIGYGHIGRHCARLLRAVGMSVHALKRDVRVGTDHADRVFTAEQLLEAVAGADHVVCILPGDSGTDGLLGEAAFARMKPTAAVYNIGRGNAIDPDALQRALRTRQIAAAFLDVLPQEPLPPQSVLWNTPNLYITPHISALTNDYLDLFVDEVVARLGSG
jgi:D-2-hydroxyacid dehydrogenase (NADP+)